MSKPLTEWRSVDEPPDWGEYGPMLLKRASGEIVEVLSTIDACIGPGGDEFPVTSVEFVDGSKGSFSQFDQWRLVEDKVWPNLQDRMNDG